MAKLTYPLEAIIDLVNPLELGAEFLGHSEIVMIGGVEVEVYIHDLEPAGEDFNIVQPVETRVKWLRDNERLARFENPWGIALGWKKDEGREGINSFSIGRILIKSRSNISETQAQKFLHAARVWAENLDLWIEVFTGADLATPSSTVEQHSEGVQVWLDTDGKSGKSVTCQHPVVIRRVKLNKQA